jgi:hypothetical protein
MTPIERFIEQTFTRSTLRHADIIRAGEQIRQWKAEEDQQTTREAADSLRSGRPHNHG